VIHFWAISILVIRLHQCLIGGPFIVVVVVVVVVVMVDDGWTLNRIEPLLCALGSASGEGSTPIVVAIHSPPLLEYEAGGRGGEQDGM